MRVICLLLFVLATTIHGAPLTWRFVGTTSAPSEYNNSPIDGLAFELRVFLDTDLPSTTVQNLADVFFTGPHQGEVEIATIGTLPVNTFGNVQYFPSSGLVVGVQFNQPAFSDIHFPASISNDSLHLTPIPPTAPISSDNTLESGVFGPNGLALFGQIASFSATLESTALPENVSSWTLLIPAVLAIVLSRRFTPARG